MHPTHQLVSQKRNIHCQQYNNEHGRHHPLTSWQIILQSKQISAHQLVKLILVIAITYRYRSYTLELYSKSICDPYHSALKLMELGMMAHAFNPSTEVAGSL